MNHQQAWDLLEDFVDEALSAGEMTAVRAHVSDCETCREAVVGLRELSAGAAALPRDITPARDLWPVIAAAIEQRPQPAAAETRPRLRLPRGIWAAAVATTAVAAVALVLVLGPKDAGGPEPGAVDPSAEQAQRFDPSTELVQTLEAECRAGEAELARYAPDPECAESGTIFTAILGEIRTIDAAISEVRTAWSSDPNSPQLVRLLASYYRAKAALQGRATRVASRVTC